MPSRSSEPSIARRMYSAEPPGGVVFGPPAELRRDHGLIAPPRKRAAEEELAVAVAVHLGGVEQRDPGTQRGVDDRARTLGVEPPAEVVATEPDDGHHEPGAPDMTKAHPYIFLATTW